MKYYICKNENKTIVVLKEITIDEYNNWIKCTEQLKYYNLAKTFRDIAIRNGLEIVKYLKNIKNNLDPHMLKRTTAAEIGIESNRLMLNYLVSFRTFVDNLEAYSKHIKKGNEFKTNILSSIYDNEPIYPFLYKLRNFATHFSMVFDSININEETIDLQCSKEHLLEYSEWNTKSKSFIKSCSKDNLPILEHIEHNNVLIMSIYLGFLLYFADDIQDMHNQVTNLIKTYQVLNPLFLSCESTNCLSQSNLFGIGLEILKEATDEISHLPNVNISYITPDDLIIKE